MFGVFENMKDSEIVEINRLIVNNSIKEIKLNQYNIDVENVVFIDGVNIVYCSQDTIHNVNILLKEYVKSLHSKDKNCRENRFMID